MLVECRMLSVNQLEAQIKLNEMWKVVNKEKFPIKVELMSEIDGITLTRNATGRAIKIKGKTTQMCKGFIGSGSRLWNKAPDSI